MDFLRLFTDRSEIIPIHKICCIYPRMMKLSAGIPYLTNIQKIYKSNDTTIDFSLHQHFFTGIQRFLLHQEMQIQIKC